MILQAARGPLCSGSASQLYRIGYLTLDGTPHDLIVPTQIHIEGIRCAAKTHFHRPNVKWGLKDLSVFILKVAKEAGVDLTFGRNLAN
jgi:hypothetical protein